MIELSFEKDLHENANENRSEVQSYDCSPQRLLETALA